MVEEDAQDKSKRNNKQKIQQFTFWKSQVAGNLRQRRYNHCIVDEENVEKQNGRTENNYKSSKKKVQKHQQQEQKTTIITTTRSNKGKNKRTICVKMVLRDDEVADDADSVSLNVGS